MNEPTTETRSVIVERDVAFPPEKIWRALTQPHLIEEWLMKNDFAPVVGHRFNFRADWGAVDCEVATSSRTRRCPIPGRPTAWRASSPGRSRRAAPAPVCAWSNRASGRISSRPTRAPSTAGRSSLQIWSRCWPAPISDGRAGGAAGLPAARRACQNAARMARWWPSAMAGALHMTSAPEYTPPEVWTWNKENGGRFANINRPIAGATHDKELPVGRHPLQLYSLATPNGVKVTIMLEELLALGHARRRIRCLADQDRRRRPVRQRLRGGQSRTPRSRRCSTAAGPSRSACSNPARSCCISPRNSAPSCRPTRRRARRMPVLAVLADGQRALSRRRLRPFLRLCADQDRICDRPLRHGGQAPARRARPAPGRERISGRRRLHDRRHRRLALVRRPGEGAAVRRRRVPAGAGLQERPALGRRDRRAPGGAARPHGQPRAGRPRAASCTSATTPATSTPRRRTSWHRQAKGDFRAASRNHRICVITTFCGQTLAIRSLLPTDAAPNFFGN